ncbi:MAG: hypothetical protein M3P94_01635 [Chloroflexota bacterium]|nr:hypothetical protein [Chloroflexota bacterium]
MRSQAAGDERAKLFRGGISMLVIGAILWPLRENWRSQPRDGFPLSYYPMFTARRGRRVAVTYIRGVDAAGGEHLLPYLCVGNGGLNQVRRQINRRIREGQASEVCRCAAIWLASPAGGSVPPVVRVELVTGRFRLADYYAGRLTPIDCQVVASLPIGTALPIAVVTPTLPALASDGMGAVVVTPGLEWVV